MAESEGSLDPSNRKCSSTWKSEGESCTCLRGQSMQSAIRLKSSVYPLAFRSFNVCDRVWCVVFMVRVSQRYRYHSCYPPPRSCVVVFQIDPSVRGGECMASPHSSIRRGLKGIRGRRPYALGPALRRPPSPLKLGSSQWKYRANMRRVKLAPMPIRNVPSPFQPK